MRKSIIGTLGLLALFLTPALQAQQGAPPEVSSRPAGTMSRKAPYRIAINPIEGTLELRNQSGKVIERWDQFTAVSPLADIPADRPVNVVIENANPLLYNYSVNAEVVRQEEIKSCRNIGSRFLSQGTLLTSAAVTGGVVPSFDLPGLSSGFLDINAAFSSTLATRGTAQLSESQLEQEMTRIRASVNNFAEFAERVATLARTMDDSISLFAASGEGIPLEAVLGRFLESLESFQPGLSDPAKTPLLIEQRASAVGPAVATLRGLVNSIQNGGYRGSRSDLAAREAVQLSARVESVVDEMETSYPVLQKNLLRIARVRAQATRVFTISESGGAIRRLVITSTSNGDYEQVLRLHDGDIEVFTRPKQGLRCDISLGLSWLEPLATFDFDADGRLIDTNSEDRRVAPVLMMHLAAPVIPSLGFAMGLGVGKHSAPDLYLGATLMTFRPIALNVGWVWQRTPQLPSGLGLGQIALDPDLRLLSDLDLKFKNTVYFGIGILR